MKPSIELERFINKYQDLTNTLAMLDFFLKQGDFNQDVYSPREINLARSILIKSMYISIYVLFEKYIDQKAVNYINNSLNDKDEALSDFIFRIQNVVGGIKFEIRRIDRFVAEPIELLRTKLIGTLNTKKRDDNYVRFINSFFDVKIEKKLEEEVQLFIAMRHCFVHHEGRVTQAWINRYGRCIDRLNIKIRNKGEKKFLPTDYMHLRLALDSYMRYARIIDEIK